MAEHSVKLENRQQLSVSGVKHIVSFDEEIVVLDTESGLLHILGEGLHITALTLENGQVALQGNNISGLEYRESAGGQAKKRSQELLRRILK